MHRGYHHRGDFEGYGVYQGVGAVTAFTPAPSTTRVGTAPAPRTATATAARSSGVVVSPVLSAGAVRIVTRKPLFTGQSGRYVRQPITRPTQTMVFTLPGTAPTPVKQAMFTLSPGVPSIGFVEQQGLWFVEEQARPILSTALGAMNYTEASGGGDPITGQANFMLGQLSGDAKARIEEKMAQGYATLLNKASVQSGVLQLLFTKNPAVIVGAAGGPAAQYALIDDEPAAVVDQAVALAGGQVAPPIVGTPVGPPVDPGIPGPGPAIEPAAAGMPKWVVPAMIGVGVLAVGAILLSTRKKAAA